MSALAVPNCSVNIGIDTRVYTGVHWSQISISLNIIANAYWRFSKRERKLNLYDLYNRRL